MPRPATFGIHQVVLADVGSLGAGIRHADQISPGAEEMLTFRLEREQHSVRCVLRRSRLLLVNVGESNAQIYHSGLQFVGVEESSDSVRQAIRKRVDRALLRQHADAWGDPSVMKGVEESSGSFKTDLLTSWMEKRPYVRCTVDRRGRWTREQVEDRAQPQNGFTVSIEEDEKEIRLLMKTYEIADAEQRNLIRLFARLVLEEPSDVPRSRYSP